MIAGLLARLRGKTVARDALDSVPRPFQAISIYAGLDACKAARAIAERRFLSRSAPALPLAECTMKRDCGCRYLKYRDRRGSERRLMAFGLATQLYNGNDRRRSKDRRRS